jgi:hypothetical protein
MVLKVSFDKNSILEYVLHELEKPYDLIKGLMANNESPNLMFKQRSKSEIGIFDDKYLYTVNQDFSASGFQSKEYLTLKKGDILRVLETDANSGVCRAENVSTGKRGSVSSQNLVASF